MTVQEIADYCCETVGDKSSEALDYAKKSLRFKYRVLSDAHNWRESMREIGPAQFDPALGGVIFLPFDAEEVIYLSLSFDGNNFRRLRYRERDWIERNAWFIPVLPTGAQAVYFYRGENLAWPHLSSGKFTFTSSDISPFQVRIEGSLANGQLVGESFSLNANQDASGNVLPVSVTTANAYVQVTSLASSGSSQPLTIFTDAQPTPYTLPAGPQSLVYTQIIVPDLSFVTSTGVANTPWYRSQIKLKPDTLADDLSVPRISHLFDALIAWTTSALYGRQRNLSKAQALEQTAMDHMKSAVNIEKEQSEFSQQAVPTTYEMGWYVWGFGD